jgi:fatty-acyl-CoA synthase
VTPPPYDGPTGVALAFRALARFPARVAFAWDGGRLTYAATLALIARLQAAMAAADARRGMCVAVLAANRVEGWCGGVAAQGLGAVTTPLHPLGSLPDHLYQLDDAGAEMLVVDVPAYRDRGGELAARAPGLRTVFTLGAAEFGADLLAPAEAAGAAQPRDLSRPDDYAVIGYTGGTTGRPKGAIRRHRSAAAMVPALWEA